MFTNLAPAPSLKPFVSGYWFVQDLRGDYRGRAIRTVPHPVAVLTINLGWPNADEFGKRVPRASLLGLQTCRRTWFSGPDTYFVMVMLSVRGLVSLFPYSCADATNKIIDLGSVLGDGESRRIADELSAAWAFTRVAELLDRWLLRLLAQATPPTETDRFVAACSCLARPGRVELAAREIDVSRRQLERWSRRLLGVGPKEFAQLHRLKTSVASVQTGVGDALSGFSDQAHQIREWRRRIGQTPGDYRASPLSRFNDNDPAGVVHYL